MPSTSPRSARRGSEPRPEALLAWSTGKDSAWTLQVLRQHGEVEVVGLLTTLDATSRRVAMHETPEELLQAQAEAAGLPLWPVEIPWPCPNEDYERAMGAALGRARAEGITMVAFGDLFLEDIRDYRIRQMAGSGLQPVFPLWQRDTAELAREMIAGGLRAIVTCVDTAQAPAALAGREFDAAFLAELPDSVDPCGERGEFHTFAWDGPMFGEPVRVVRGATRETDGFARMPLAAC